MADKLEFYAYERMPDPERDQRELDELAARLAGKLEANRYRTHHHVYYEQPASRGYTVLKVLQELWGLPLSDLVMAYVHALRPSAIRITDGIETTDAYPWRVTIRVDGDDKVKEIRQEVEIGYGSGYDVGQCLQAAKGGPPPRTCSGVFGHIGGLERIDFT